MHPLRRLYGYARAYRRNAVLGTVYSVLNKIFDVLPELLIGVAIDVVVNREDSFIARFGIVDPMDQLVALTALTVAIWVLESLFEYLLALKWRGLAQDLQHELRLDAYAHLQALPPAAISEARTGRLMAVLNEDVNQVERFLNTGANELIQVVVGSLMVGAFFFAMTASLAALALLPVPLILIGAFWFQKRLQPRYAAAREAAATVSARLDNNLAGMATIQAYTAEDAELEHVRRASDDYRQANAEAIRFAAAITPVIRMAVLAGFAVTLLYGGALVLDGELGAGSYAALVYLTQRLLWPLTRLAEMTDLYNRSMASVQRVMDLLESPLPPRPTGRIEGRARGALVFDALQHAYGDRVALGGVSVRIEPGQTVALVGATGAGKSTVLKRLMGFLEAQGGRITLDGIDLAGVDPASIRTQIGYVAQEPFLTDGTVAENIAYGSVAYGSAAYGVADSAAGDRAMADRGAAVDLARIEAAARAAEAHDFIAAMPEGYASAVGERGARLSGGQRQRIALARALYRDPAVLVLDEATSAIDNETEAAIQRSLSHHAKGRSTLVVAHRLSTVRHADAIHVLERGRIIESGTHEALLARGGAYAALWKLQTGEA